jgi:T5SS/PEP-CTERM-associated repeat protein
MRTLLAGTAICCLASSATAQSEAVWQGTNCSPRNWSDAQCWRDGILPDTTQPLSYRFAGNIRSIPYNDLGGKGTLSFESGLPSGFEIRGSSNFDLSVLSNTSGQNIKVSMPVTFNLNFVDGGTGGVSFTGPVALGVGMLPIFARLTIDTSSAIGANTTLKLTDGARATFADIALSGAQIDTQILRLSGKDVSLTSRSGVALTGTGVGFFANAHPSQSVLVSDGATLKGITGTIGGVAGSDNWVTVFGAGSSWISTGTLVIGSPAGGQATLALKSGGRASAGYAAAGVAKVGAITVDGDGSALDVANTLSIGGSGGQGTLNVSGGGRVSSTYLYVGNDSGSLGFVDLSGAGTNGQVGNTLFVGNFGGTGVITIGSGAALQAPTLNIGNGGTVRIEGGSLGVASLTLGASGSSLLLAGGSANLGSLAMSGGTLETTAPGSAAPPAGAPVGTDIALRGAGGAITNIGGIQGFGTVAAPLYGGSSSTIRASGGTLALGDVAAADGYAFGGRLEVATGARALLQSASPVALSGATWLEAGATLASVNGLVQAAIAPSGLWLVYDHDATIEGRFINDGMVGAYTFGGWLTITGLLSGHGGQFYYGRTRLTAGIAAEHGSGRLGFGGGDLSFAVGSVLNLAIAGTPDSGLYDQLMGIGQLSFQGSLHLDFEPGFDVASGGHYALLDFGSATGSLAAGDIVVTGLDARRVDASHLLIDGSIDVAAVPEPATTALWASGLGMLGWGTRRARRAMRTRAS